jgi:hypothetical protein
VYYFGTIFHSVSASQFRFWETLFNWVHFSSNRNHSKAVFDLEQVLKEIFMWNSEEVMSEEVVTYVILMEQRRSHVRRSGYVSITIEVILKFGLVSTPNRPRSPNVLSEEAAGNVQLLKSSCSHLEDRFCFNSESPSQSKPQISLIS